MKLRLHLGPTLAGLEAIIGLGATYLVSEIPPSRVMDRAICACIAVAFLGRLAVRIAFTPPRGD